VGVKETRCEEGVNDFSTECDMDAVLKCLKCQQYNFIVDNQLYWHLDSVIV